MNPIGNSLRSAWIGLSGMFCAVLAAAHAAPLHEAGVLTVTQADEQTWHGAQFARAFPVPPVVILGPATFNDAQPTTLRVRNVTSTGFEYQVDEWDYQDGIHGEEQVSWLALEPGVHEIGGQKWEAGRVSGVTRTATTITLTGDFTAPPVVLAQVDSVINPRAVTARVHSIGATTFRVRLKSQQAFLGVLKGESVAYVAISEGTGDFDGAPFRAANTTFKVNHKWKPVDFQVAYAAPAFFAATQSMNDAEPCTVRMQNLSDSGVEVRVHEERSRPGPVTHAGETLGYLILSAPSDETRAKLEFGTLTHQQISPDVWQSFAFDQSYSNPVVIFGPVPEGDGEPAMIRVRNVTGAGFEFQVDEWDYQDGVHPSALATYLVMEAGDYTLGGLRWHAGRVTDVTHAPKAEPFSQPFVTVPVVLAQVATTNEATAVNDRVSGVSGAGFTLQLEEEEAADRVHTGEVVHYVAIEQGSGRFTNDILFQAAASIATVNHQFQRIDFERNAAAPVFLGDPQSRNDTDPVVPRYRNLETSGVDVRLQEETSADVEAVHGGEVVGLLVVAGAVDMDEDGLADQWEIDHGLDPNNPNDAIADTDGDGFNALAEFRYGTNPNSFDNGGTLTAVASLADAFEKEGTSARIRIERTGGVVPVTVSFSVTGTAGTAEYSVRNAIGAALTGSISIPFGSDSAEVLIAPVIDNVNEYPESVSLTVLPATGYTVGVANNASVKVNDAANTPENEQLFVAFLRAQNGAETFASGLGTLFLNGSKSSARVNLSFSGLTSNQTNAYIRYGLPQGIGPELRPTLPNGQVTGQLWTIVPVGTISGQDIIDGLFQAPGKYTYINVGTGNYPVGEIAGTWTRQTGSTVFQPPGDPPALEPAVGDDLARDVARFLTQATFGPTKAKIDALVATITTAHGGDRIAGFNAWIDQQFALDQTSLLDYTRAADAEEFDLRDADPANPINGNEPDHNNRRRGWWLIAAKAHDELRQRLAFALSEIFVISDKETEIRRRHYGAAKYYDQLAGFADGNYRDLLETVSKSPMMGKYLSHLKNQKAIVDPVTGQVIVSPDENYAREVMQLFSIGLVYRHADGTLKLGADGLPIPTYSNEDITELARVFTGWSFGKRHGARNEGYPVIDNVDFNQGNGPPYFQASWENPMTNFAEYHDTGTKSVLGMSIPAGLDGEADLDAALDILFNHENTASFISHLLIQRLVTSNPSAGYIYRVAQKFINNGSGRRGDLKAVVKAVLLDYEARSLEVTENIGYGKQKEPIVRYLQLIRAFDGGSQIPLTRLSGFGYPSMQLDNFPTGATLLRYPVTDARLGQTPQGAPTVFNWFLPDYSPGGAISSAGLVAPEMQLTTETSVVNAINYHYTLTNTSGQSVNPMVGATNGTEDDVRINRNALTQLYNAELAAGRTVKEAVTTVLDYVDIVMLSGRLRASYSTAPAPNPRSIIIDAVASLPLTTGPRMQELLYLVVSSPEYVNQK